MILLKLRLPYLSSSLKRGFSSHALANRSYSKSRSWRLSNSCSSRRQASSTPASGVASRPLERTFIGSLLQAYSKTQAQRPYTTQICTSVLIWLCGDLSAQLLFPPEPVGNEENGEIQKPQEAHVYDPWRTARHLTVGIVASIPSYEWCAEKIRPKWFMFLHRRFNFASGALSLATKVLVQQAVYTPVFNTYFFTMQSLLSGASVEQTLMRLQLALPTSIVNGWKVWTGVAIVSFIYIPPQFRSVFSGCVAVAWQSYLSWTNQKVARELPKKMGEMEGVSL
ncbi:Protein SYM1 [Penicillium rolfsii]|nr:Protein SYM1 [Penicillium rolfsii]